MPSAISKTVAKYYQVVQVMNGVGFISALTIFLILGILAIYDYKMVNRISLRLTAAIAFTDLVIHANNFVRNSMSEGPWCALSGFLRVFGRQAYCFLNISIALNLHLILLIGLRPKAKWEKYYWALSFLVPLAMNLPPLALGMFGYNGTMCLLRNVGNRKLLLAINLPLVILITFVYCTVISLLVMFRLRAKLSIVRNLSPNQGRLEAANIPYRPLPPFTCVVSMLFYFIANVHNLLVGPSNGLLVIAMFGL
ncbi:hypothetical protein L0F63_003310, partial [Massospora cicadina]